MAYEPTIWKDRAIERPKTFNIVNNPDGTVTLVPVTGAVAEPGTPVNAANLNKLEQAVKTHEAEIATQDTKGHVKIDNVTIGIDEDEKIFLKDIPYDDLSNSPGSKFLLTGTMNVGYFGLVANNELITATELAAQIGLSSGIAFNSSENWFKFAYNKRILFVAKKPFRHSLSWDNINAVGAVFGEKTININGITYKVRLLMGGDSNPANGVGREWLSLIYGIHTSQIPTLASYSDIDIGVGGSLDGRNTLCQETVNSDPSRKVVMGYTGVTSFGGAPPATNSNLMGWRPVLEVVI